MTLQAQIDRLRRQIEVLQEQQRRCAHEWDDVAYNPRIIAGYRTKPMHWHPGRHCEDVWIPEQRFPRWTRTCLTCGLEQHTETTKEVSRPGTMPGTTATEKVPTFRD